MEYYNSQCLLHNLVRENNLLKSQINSLSNIIANNKSSTSENTSDGLSKDEVTQLIEQTEPNYVEGNCYFNTNLPDGRNILPLCLASTPYFECKCFPSTNSQYDNMHLIEVIYSSTVPKINSIKAYGKFYTQINERRAVINEQKIVLTKITLDDDTEIICLKFLMISDDLGGQQFFSSYQLITRQKTCDIDLKQVTIKSEEEIGTDQYVPMFGEYKAYEIEYTDTNLVTSEGAVKNYVDGKIAELEQKINDSKGAGA